MNRSPVEDNENNFFHSLAALGQSKLALKTLSTTQKKVVATGLSARDKTGKTPLHVAAYHGNLKVLKAFLEASPEAGEIRDGDGNSVMDALRRPDAPVIGDPENQKYFQRLVKIDKKGCEHQDFGQGPMDVWDVAISGNSMVAAVQPTWSDNQSRVLYALMKGSLQQLELGAGNIPRYVATSNVHSLVLTADKCFAWGKNVNGVLGLDVDEKIVTEPKPLDKVFVELSQSDHMNTFSALGASGAPAKEFKDPLIGVDCCDFHSLCYTTKKVWAWGANRGQMMNKAARNTIIDTPVMVYQSSTRIRTVKCCDNAIVILLSNGQVHLLSGDRATRLQSGKNTQEISAMAGRGDYVVVQTNMGKLLRFSLKSSMAGKDEITVLWTPRRKKDEVTAFDVADNGGVVVATKSSVFRVEEGREVVEFKSLKGMPLATIKTDSQFRNVVGVNNILAGFDFGLSQTPVKRRYDQSLGYVQWGTSELSDPCNMGDLTLRVGDESLQVHSSVLYARCPTLRDIVTEAKRGSANSSVVAVPSGSGIFRCSQNDKDTLFVEHSPLASVSAFVKSLYYAQISPKPNFTAGIEVGPVLHEYHALERLITRDLGIGLWDARLANIGCDVLLKSTHHAHSAILAAVSPVLAAQLSRWTELELDDPALSVTNIDDVLRYAYTLELGVSDRNVSEPEHAQRLFELWQVADELLIPSLSEECERRLFEMINFDLLLPFIQVASHSQGTSTSRLYSSLLDVIVRYLSYFMPLLGELEPDTLDGIERLYKSTVGTQPIDKELADSFEKLKLQSHISTTTPKQGKKSRAGSASLSSGSLAQAQSVVGSPDTSLSSPSPKAAASGELGNRSSFPSADTTSSPSINITARQSRKPNDQNTGWIQTRRKQRTLSLKSTEKRDDASPLTSPTPKTPSASASSSSAPSSLPAASPTPGANRSGILGNNSPANATPSLLSLSQPSSSASSLSSVSPMASSSALPSLGQLPKLGDNLPSLGSKPRSSSGNKGSARPKFSRKDKKNVQQFDDPALFAETFGNKPSSSSTPATPWKQVPKVVQTSQSVLQKLERVQQINNRKVSGGSVWGV